MGVDVQKWKQAGKLRALAMAALIIAAGAKSSEAQFNAMYLPHMLIGSNWNTQVFIHNPNSSGTNYKVDFFDFDGRPLQLEVLNTGIVTSYRDSILPHATKLIQFYIAQTPFGLHAPGLPSRTNQVQGWLRIVPDSPLQGTAILQEFSANPPTTFEATVPLIQGTTVSPFTMFADDAGNHVAGIACVNAGQFSVQLSISGYDDFGSRVVLDNVQVLSGQHIQFVVPEKYPAMKNTTGFLSISISTPVLPNLPCVGFTFADSGTFSTILPNFP